MMKNREKYNEFLEECLINGRKFGIDKNTSEPHICDLNTKCANCKFSTLKKTCSQFRKDWLEEEVDEWAEFRDLKRGDIILVNPLGLWYPVIFVKLDEFGIHFTSSVNENGIFTCCIDCEKDPKRVKKLISGSIIV